MPKYLIETKVVIGYYCMGGAEIDSGHAYLELSDKEVSDIKDLVQKTGTTNIEDMKLADAYPEIFSKLEGAYNDAAINGAEWYWNTDAWSKRDDDYYGIEYDYDYAVNLAESYLGYDPNKTKAETKREEKEYFERWLDKQIYFHRSEELERLLVNLFHSEPEYDGLKEEMRLPDQLLKDIGF